MIPGSGRTAAVVALTAALVGCATTSPEAAIRDASGEVERRSGHRIQWSEDGEDAAKVDRLVGALLKERLTADTAASVALLRNKELQASYEDIGIAQADLVQAGLLKNPSVSGALRFPLDPGAVLGGEISLAQSLLELLTIGPRKDSARASLEASVVRVAHQVLVHVAETKSAFYTLQAAEQTYAMRAVVAEAAQTAADLAKKQNEAGTINDLSLANEEALAAQVGLELSRSRADVASARERLNRLMGLWGRETDWRSAEKLPELPTDDPAATRLESLAIGQRLDLRAASKDVEAIDWGLTYAKTSRWIPGLGAGIAFEKASEGYRLLGPSVTVEVPLFDQGRAGVARLEAQLRQAKARESKLAVDIRSEVREGRVRMETQRRVVQTYRDTLVPLRERIVALSQQQYDAMLLGVFQLLLARREEINAYRDYIEALRDYWIARAELDLRAGGALTSTRKAAP